MLVHKIKSQINAYESTLELQLGLVCDAGIASVAFNILENKYYCEIFYLESPKEFTECRAIFSGKLDFLKETPSFLILEIRCKNGTFLHVKICLALIETGQIFLSKQELSDNQYSLCVKGWSPAPNVGGKIKCMASSGIELPVYRTARRDVLDSFPLITNPYCGWEVVVTKADIVDTANKFLLFLFRENANSTVVVIKLESVLLEKLKDVVQSVNVNDLIPTSEVFRRMSNNKEVFDKIYQDKLWGATVLSGPGSDGNALIESVKLSAHIISKLNAKVVVDLGCGGFYFGRHIIKCCQSYLGIDVSSNIIEVNRRDFPNVDFKELDATRAIPPQADLVIIRQVFQHLSNSDITDILDNIKLSKSKYILVFEDVPLGYFKANIDLEFSQASTRKIFNSGVRLSEPPFSLNVDICSDVPLTDGRILEASFIRL